MDVDVEKTAVIKINDALGERLEHQEGSVKTYRSVQNMSATVMGPWARPKGASSGTQMYGQLSPL